MNKKIKILLAALMLGVMFLSVGKKLVPQVFACDWVVSACKSGCVDDKDVYNCSNPGKVFVKKDAANSNPEALQKALAGVDGVVLSDDVKQQLGISTVATTAEGTSPYPTLAPGQVCFPGTFDKAGTDVEIKCDTSCGANGGFVCKSDGSGFISTCNQSQGGGNSGAFHACGYTSEELCNTTQDCASRGYGSNVTCQVSGDGRRHCVGPSGRYFTKCGGPGNCQNCYSDGSCDWQTTSCGQKSECRDLVPKVTPPPPGTTPPPEISKKPPKDKTLPICSEIKLYFKNEAGTWESTSAAEMVKKVGVGDEIRVAVKGSKTSVKYARFSINGKGGGPLEVCNAKTQDACLAQSGATWCNKTKECYPTAEKDYVNCAGGKANTIKPRVAAVCGTDKYHLTTQKNDKGEFFIPYVLEGGGEYSFEAEIYTK